jgi:hypothetical protein
MSRRHLVRRNPAVFPSDIGHVFIRVPQGTALSSLNLRANLAGILGAGNVDIYWVGDGKHCGVDKKIVLGAWKIDGPYEWSEMKDALAFSNEFDALAKLRGDYKGNRGTSTLYQVICRSPGAVTLKSGAPFNLDRLPATDPDREAAWTSIRPAFPIKPEGVVTVGAGSTSWHGYGQYGGYPPPSGYPYGQPGPYPHPQHTSAHWAGYGTGTHYTQQPFPYPPMGSPVPTSYVASHQIGPQQSLEQVMMDHYREAALENAQGPLENLGWTGAPRKNALVSEYIGFTIPNDLVKHKAPTAEWWTTRSINSIDEIPQGELPVLVSLLWNTLSEDAKTSPKARAALKLVKKADMFQNPYLIQWRVLEPVQRGDVRYYVCQWKLAYEPHRYETTGNVLYKTF